MKKSSFTHVPGCWVSQQLPGEKNIRRGIVKNAFHGASGDELQVQWFSPEKSIGNVLANAVSSGFQNGMDVLDETPGSGIVSLGVGVIMQQRTIAGSQQ